MASLDKIAHLVAVLITCFFVLAENKPNTAIVEDKCSNTRVDEAGHTDRAINRVHNQLLSSAAIMSYNFEWADSVGDFHSWGSAACNGALTFQDCTECLRIAKDLLIQSCPLRDGAHIKLTDCRLRYEPYEFHGRW